MCYCGNHDSDRDCDYWDILQKRPVIGMKAVFKLSTLCVVIEDDGSGVLLEPVEGDEDQRFWVPFDSPSLLLDPTDDEIGDLWPNN